MSELEEKLGAVLNDPKMMQQIKLKCPQKVRQIFLTQIVQATQRACCLCKAGGKPFNFSLPRLLL